MANSRKILKAYVRYDGTGTLIPGSLTLRNNKPRVKKALQVSPTYECCNPIPSEYLLLEDGSRLVTENGDYLILY